MLRFCSVVLAVAFLGGCQPPSTPGSSSTIGPTVVIAGDSVMIGHGDTVMIGHGDTVMVGHGDSVMIGHGDSVRRNGIWMRRCHFEIEWWQPFDAHKRKVVALTCPKA